MCTGAGALPKSRIRYEEISFLHNDKLEGTEKLITTFREWRGWISGADSVQKRLTSSAIHTYTDDNRNH